MHTILKQYFGPSQDKLEANRQRARADDLQAALDAALAREKRLQATLEQHRNLDRYGPMPGTVELQLRTIGANGAPLTARYQLHRMQLCSTKMEVGAILAKRCSELYQAIAEEEQKFGK